MCMKLCSFKKNTHTVIFCGTGTNYNKPGNSGVLVACGSTKREVTNLRVYIQANGKGLLSIIIEIKTLLNHFQYYYHFCLIYRICVSFLELQ
jgi:hypothetical protein